MTKKKNLNTSIRNLFFDEFVVPLYQRNYAWGEEEIYQLLQDIYEAYSKGTGQYFIGSLVVLKRKDGTFEVIDGQQRLTTIILISKLLDKENFKVPKLHFDSRPEVEAFLHSFYQNGDVIDTTNSHLVSHFKEAVEYIRTANLNVKEESRITISDLIQRGNKSFIDYFFNNVIIVKVEIPNDTDVAHYFEVMNNRGEQLEKHEILKARLLDKIRDDKRASNLFSKVWDACSQMNTPIQKLFNLSDTKKFFGQNYNNFIWGDVYEESNRSRKDELTIKQILEGRIIDFEEDKLENENDYHYSSILDFPNFLMHVLKINEDRYEKQIPLNGDELLDFFDEVKEKIDPISFVKDLLYYRVVFDRFIVKAFDDEREEDNYKWMLIKPERYYNEKKNQNRLIYKNSFNNQEEIIKCLSMLQVTFRTKKYKNWLQSILSWFKDEVYLDIGENQYLHKLNKLVLTRYNESDEAQKIDKGDLYDKGTRTPHYLFNFLDYLLWMESPERFKFDFKYRNSVEHHLPQSYKNADNKDYIDHFGNLCLISKGGNSKLNDQRPVGKADPENKYNNNRLPPKQKLMYEMTNSKGRWDNEEIEEHYREIKEILNKRNKLLKI